MEWKSLTYEEHAWDRDDDYWSLIPKSRRRIITDRYQAALPSMISNVEFPISSEVAQRVNEVGLSVARLDASLSKRAYSLPALMLRSESTASSQIEHLTSSAKNIALAELSLNAPSNAQEIAGNVSAMRKAIESEGALTVEEIVAIHDVLIGAGSRADETGIRQEQVWVGGTSYSPHGALFVPPHHSRVEALLADLVSFMERSDIAPVAKAAIAHAQFETIHPFTDGNGRTGRALLHRMLARDEVAMNVTLPISAGLLHDIDSYMSALDSFHNGEVDPIISCMCDALEVAVVIGAEMAEAIDEVIERWESEITERKSAAIWSLPALLVSQPVVNSAYVAEKMDMSQRAAMNLINRGCELGILKPMGNAKRGLYYQCPDIIGVLENSSDAMAIRRMRSRR